MEKIKFQIEIKRVLDVLSKEIYDSPYALLRENVQNAYDAILMRTQYTDGKWTHQLNGMIKVQIDPEKIVISDNGIGMSESVLKENYWKAGASGKKTALAAKSGVVGTFGIGAMANFGVCTKLKVETESMETKERIVSEVERDGLSLYEDCIGIDKVSSIGEYGTTITTFLDAKAKLTLEQARSYLMPFVQYLPVKVELNGTNVSQKSIEEQYRDNSASIQDQYTQTEYSGVKADVLIQCNDAGRISAMVNNILLSKERINGIICLRQDAGHLWGLRSSFGLAPIPISSYYSFGGIVNISIISPTAGREALSRESVDLVTRIINLVQDCATNTLAKSEICNKNTNFMSHVLSMRKFELAKKLQIKVEPSSEITLEVLKEYSQKSKYKYYEGNDDSIIKAHGTPDTPLIVLSRSNPRRELELLFIQQLCKSVEKVKEAPSVLKVYSENSLEMNEISFIIRTKNILKDDYALQNVEIKFADLSHGLPLIVQRSNENYIEIFIQKNHPTIKPILMCYYDSYDVFAGFTKDYIRNYIYSRIQNWVPSSTREGADALLKILRQKKELYEIKTEDFEMTSLFSDFMSNKISFKDVITKSSMLIKNQAQEIKSDNIGKLETEIPNLAESPIQTPKEEPGQQFPPMPAIMRTDVITEKKLLQVEKPSSYLNNFSWFLAISNRAFSEESEFFIAPHTTRVIWGGHRIIYIFTHVTGKVALYYDIEMFKDTPDLAGGGIFPTTTIFTKKRIFIPIPDNLKEFFKLIEGKRSFYVRFDTIYNN